MRVPEETLNRLRAAGLVVSSEPFVPDHVAFPDGVVVGKPADVPGHSLPGYQAWWGMTTRIDAPTLYLHHDGERWIVTSHDWVPGPGPGDFVDAWDTHEQAADDILDFYFGSPDRMARKRDR